jgi:xylulokinase
MEGVGYEINWILQSLQKTKVKLNSIKSLGGATKSRVWMQIVADITGLTINNPAYPDAPVLGAALIAGCNSGIFDSISEACAIINKDSYVIHPNVSAYEQYIPMFEDYKHKFELVRKSYMKKDA